MSVTRERDRRARNLERVLRQYRLSQKVRDPFAEWTAAREAAENPAETRNELSPGHPRVWEAAGYPGSVPLKALAALADAVGPQTLWSAAGSRETVAEER
jgi:hypothetical protein